MSSYVESRPVVYRGEVIEDYYVDQEGYIYSTKRGYFYKLSIQQGDSYNPYPKVSIKVKDKQKTVSVHRLVCESYHPRPLPNILSKKQWNSIEKEVRTIILEHIQHADRYQVNHIDHDINNFHPSNLEWVTVMENQQKYQEHKRNVA